MERTNGDGVLHLHSEEEELARSVQGELPFCRPGQEGQTYGRGDADRPNLCQDLGPERGLHDLELRLVRQEARSELCEAVKPNGGRVDQNEALADATKDQIDGEGAGQVLHVGVSVRAALRYILDEDTTAHGQDERRREQASRWERVTPPAEKLTARRQKDGGMRT